MTAASAADHIWHSGLRVECVMAGRLMTHASEEALRGIEPGVGKVLAVTRMDGSTEHFFP